MQTLTNLAAAIAANLAADMPSIQQNMSQLDTLLNDLRTAGVAFEIDTRQTGIYSLNGKTAGMVTIRITSQPNPATIRTACEAHGGRWSEYLPGKIHTSINDVSLHIERPTPAQPEAAQ